LCFGKFSALLHQKHHNVLLSDDKAFSRTTTYFSAVNLLGDVDKSLQAKKSPPGKDVHYPGHREKNGNGMPVVI
jgi:hypothetical protein